MSLSTKITLFELCDCDHRLHKWIFYCFFGLSFHETICNIFTRAILIFHWYSIYDIIHRTNVICVVDNTLSQETLQTLIFSSEIWKKNQSLFSSVFHILFVSFLDCSFSIPDKISHWVLPLTCSELLFCFTFRKSFVITFYRLNSS